MLIVDLGSQYTLIIARTLRELGVRSAVLSPGRAEEWLKLHPPKAIILSGGDASVTDANAPQPPSAVCTLGAPLLGICYGMQWLAHTQGGRLHKDQDEKEYGPATVIVDSSEPLFTGLTTSQKVWASHGDSVVRLPRGFTQIATSKDTGGVEAMSDAKRRVWGVQFHPEVAHTQYGKRMLRNFVFGIAGCEKDWLPQDLVAALREETADTIDSAKVIVGFSGGVDSTVATAILAPVLGKRLRAITIDGGQLREGELAEIKATARHIGVALRVVDAKERFQKVLSRITDAEKKRAAFKKVYTEVLREEAKTFAATGIVQGTLATDNIESGVTGGALIKSHHNVGLKLGVKFALTPLASLFKYEVRALAQALDLPPHLALRHPFPGPGLFVRVVGSPATTERLALVRWADAQVQRILAEHGELKNFTQLIVALLATPTVGVKGDARVYGPSILVRAVITSDFMTVEGYQFPAAVRREIVRAVPKHPHIVRVLFDETPKPPATTEFE